MDPTLRPIDNTHSETQQTINYSELPLHAQTNLFSSNGQSVLHTTVEQIGLEHNYAHSLENSQETLIYADLTQLSNVTQLSTHVDDIKLENDNACSAHVQLLQGEHNYAKNCSPQTCDVMHPCTSQSDLTQLSNVNQLSTNVDDNELDNNKACSAPVQLPPGEHNYAKNCSPQACDATHGCTSPFPTNYDLSAGKICSCSPVQAAHLFNIPAHTVPPYKHWPMYLTCATTQFDNELRISDRFAQNSLGDGNCFFRCISLNFFAVEEFHIPIRRKIVSFMSENLDIFSHDIGLNRHKLSISQYLEHMFNGGQSVLSWATDIEIEATATLLQTPVYVLGRYGRCKSWQRFLPRFQTEQSILHSNPYLTILNTGTHYMLVRPIHVHCNCLCEAPTLSLCSTEQEIIHIEEKSATCSKNSNKKIKLCQDNNETEINMNCTDGKTVILSAKKKGKANVNDEPVRTQRKGKANGNDEPGSAFLTAIREGPHSVCDTCQKTFYPTSIKQYAMKQTWINLLKDLPITANDISICSRCYSSLKQDRLPPLCILNNLKVDPVPHELKDLNVAEQKMISLAHVYLKMIILPYGQKAINGQVINFPYNVQEQVKHFSQEGLVLVRVSSQKEGTIPKQYVVDTGKITSALSWLKVHNSLYSQISIPKFTTKHQLPTVVSIPSNANLADKTDQNDGWLPETSVTHKDPVLPKVDFKKFVDDINVPTHEIVRNTNHPINMFKDSQLEEMAFPLLFPNGKNGLRTPRKFRLTVLQYFQARLLSVDNRWQSNLPYLFWATNMTEKEKLSEGINIAARIRSSTTRNRAACLTAGAVRDDLTNNPDYPEHFYGFMKSIRGSAAYWNAAQLDLLSMIRAKGPMTFFLTLSANDMNWDDLMQVLLRQLGKPNTPEAISKLTRQEKRDLMAKNPVTTARHFCRRVHHIIHSFILSEEKPLGQVIDYFWRIEFQMRGSPHLHSLWWVQDAPDLDSPEGVAAAPEFIDKYISTEIPDDDPFMKKRVEALQKHHHTSTCKKYEKLGNNCRFGFPHTISPKTTMKNIANMRTSPHCYVLRRAPGSEYINAYNPAILKVWNANMDIQLVAGAQGAAKYVCSYICKAESDEVVGAVKEAVQNLPPEASTKKQLSAIGNVFLSHRQLSAQEAAFKMCGLPLRGSSAGSIFINARPERQRHRLLKPKQELSNLHDDSTSIFAPNIFERYQGRPNTTDFNSMTLAHFAVNYTSCKNAKNAIPLENGIGFIQQRRKELVMRTPKFNIETQEENYYFSFLLLYLPWRNEDDLLEGSTSAKEAFNKSKHLLQKPESHNHAEEIERAIKEIQRLNDTVLQNYIAPVVAPNTEANNDDEANKIINDPDYINFVESPQIKEFHEDQDWSFEDNVPSGVEDDVHLNNITFTRLTDNQYDQQIQSLNPEQIQAFSVVKCYFDQLQNVKMGQQDYLPSPIHLFISGPGGTGKSHLISLLQELIIRCSLDSISKDSPPVVVTAPTGVAAYNIGGVTLHRALNLPVQHGPSPKYVPLKGERLAMMRKQWKNTNTIIIDEISMVSYETFTHVHQRLNDIKCAGDEHIFGNLNVITLGDFYQLPPVSPGHFIFAGDSGRAPLWKCHFKMIELTRNMRQKDDKEYGDLLLRVRTATHTKDDIQTLKQRSADVVHEEEFTSALRLFPISKSCDTYNHYRLSVLGNDSVIYTINAKHAFVEISHMKRKINSNKVSSEYLPEDERECAGLPNKLHLCIGATVMLRRNIDTSVGLVNGARGIVTAFIWKDGLSPLDPTSGEMPTKIAVQFFNSKLAVANESGSFCIEPMNVEFFGKKGTVIVRTQFPLTLSWATTIHKAQGVTLESAVIDIGKDAFSAGMSYVALSRVKYLGGLVLVDMDENKIRCSDCVANEMQRLRDASATKPQLQQSCDLNEECKSNCKDCLRIGKKSTDFSDKQQFIFHKRL